MNPLPPVILINRATAESLLTLPDCISAVEAAFTAHANGRSLHPGLMHMEGEGGEFHIKAGGLRSTRAYFAAKINGGFFNNRISHNLPNIIGLILLSDATTGVPLALIESSHITRLRTGAATAVAAKYLARDDSRTVTICGAGLQAAIQLRALTHVFPLRTAYVWSRDPERTASFVRRQSDELDIQIIPIPPDNLADATSRSDIIITCTPAKSWILGRTHVRPGTFIAAVGADSPDKQELEPELLAQSSVVCDLTDQCVHVGDLHHAIAAGLMTRAQLRGELGEIIVGKRHCRANRDETIIFDSTGTALQDTAGAAIVYENAQRTGRGSLFSF